MCIFNVTVNISGGDYDKLKIIGEEGAVLKGSLTVNDCNVLVQGLTIDGEAEQLFNDEELEKIRANTYTTAKKTEFALCESAYRTEGVILNGRGCELIGCTVYDVMGTAASVSGDNAYVADNYISKVGGGIVTGCKNGIIENNEINRINCFFGEGGSGDVFRLFGNNVIICRNYAHGTAEDDVWHALSKTAAHADFIRSFDDNKTESGNMLIENNIAHGFYHQGIKDNPRRNRITTGFTGI